jgi:hypothetical protein
MTMEVQDEIRFRNTMINIRKFIISALQYRASRAGRPLTDAERREIDGYGAEIERWRRRLDVLYGGIQQ